MGLLISGRIVHGIVSIISLRVDGPRAAGSGASRTTVRAVVLLTARAGRPAVQPAVRRRRRVFDIFSVHQHLVWRTARPYAIHVAHRKLKYKEELTVIT